jgi:threonine/homoserine/homoserine lactone efflux protein
VPPHAPVLATVLALASIQVLVSILWYTGVAWFVNQARRLFARDDVRRRMEQVSGLLLIGFGVRMAVQQR